MKKIFYFIAAIGITWGIVSCDNEPKNPGDFNKKAELSIGDIVSTVTGEVYSLKEVRAFDTIFTLYETVWDTIWGPTGEFQERVQDTIWYKSKHHTRYHEMAPIILPAYADTFEIQLTTNARWLCPPPEATVVWVYNEGSQNGGGDGTLTFRIGRNRNFNRTTYSDMMIYTSDSTVWYKIPLGQYGEKGE